MTPAPMKEEEKARELVTAWLKRSGLLLDVGQVDQYRLGAAIAAALRSEWNEALDAFMDVCPGCNGTGVLCYSCRCARSLKKPEGGNDAR